MLEYIEDCFSNSDIQGLKKFIGKLKEKHGDAVKVGVNSLFESNLDQIKEYTLLIQEEIEEEDEEEIEPKKEEEDPEKPAE